MLFGFSCLNYNEKDENDLCMKENTIPNEHSYLAPIKYGENEFVVKIKTINILNSSSEFLSYSLEGDHEQVSMQMVSRYLLKCSDCLVYPSSLTPHIKVCTENTSMFKVLKSRIGISLSAIENEGDSDMTAEDTSIEADLQHSISFQLFHTLFENGYQAFATDDQLRGVASIRVDDNCMNVCAIKTISSRKHSEDYTMTFEMLRYKTIALTIDIVRNYDEEVKSLQKTTSEIDPTWRVLARPMSCVFLPTNETIELLAVIPYIPQKITSTTNTTTSQRIYEQEIFLTPLDRANRTHGYSNFLPDTYPRVRLYWELAYGIHLPKCPGETENDCIYFARVSLPLGEQIVPLCALARGTSQIPWENEAYCRRAATDIQYILQSCSLIENISLPQRPTELTQQLRDRIKLLNHSVNNHYPSSGVFASALRYKQQQSSTDRTELHIKNPSLLKLLPTVLKQSPQPCCQDVIAMGTADIFSTEHLNNRHSQESASSVSLSLSDSSASAPPVLHFPRQQQKQHAVKKTSSIHSFNKDTCQSAFNKKTSTIKHANQHVSNSKVTSHAIVNNNKTNSISITTSKQPQGRFQSPVLKKRARRIDP